MEIYNPWSVNNYFSEHCTAEAYWVDTSSNDIIQTMLAQADEARWEELRSLMTGGTVMARVREGVIYDEIGKNAGDIYTMLLQTGCCWDRPAEWCGRCRPSPPERPRGPR